MQVTEIITCLLPAHEIKAGWFRSPISLDD